MNKIDDYLRQIDNISFSASDRQIRLLAIFSAFIAHGDYDTTVEMIKYLRDKRIPDNSIYEAVLQSYLFLGFPRMIEAGLAYNQVFGDVETADMFKEVSPEESNQWFSSGQDLCRKVYGSNYERLKKKFIASSPEIFRWMVFEGYGKVLSRPGMSNIERELAEVAALIYDRRERQLVSHVIGSLNVGASFDLIYNVSRDIKFLVGDKAHSMANNVIAKIEKKNENAK